MLLKHHCATADFFLSSLQWQQFLLRWTTLNLQVICQQQQKKKFFKSRIRQVNVKYTHADLKSHSMLPFISIKIRSGSSMNSSLIHSLPKARASRRFLCFQERKKGGWFPHGLQKTILEHAKCCCLSLHPFKNTSSFGVRSTGEAVRGFLYWTWPFLLPTK